MAEEHLCKADDFFTCKVVEFVRSVKCELKLPNDRVPDTLRLLEDFRSGVTVDVCAADMFLSLCPEFSDLEGEDFLETAIPLHSSLDLTPSWCRAEGLYSFELLGVLASKHWELRSSFPLSNPWGLLPEHCSPLSLALLGDRLTKSPELLTPADWGLQYTGSLLDEREFSCTITLLSTWLVPFFDGPDSWCEGCFKAGIWVPITVLSRLFTVEPTGMFSFLTDNCGHLKLVLPEDKDVFDPLSSSAITKGDFVFVNLFVRVCRFDLPGMFWAAGGMDVLSIKPCLPCRVRNQVKLKSFAISTFGPLFWTHTAQNN